MGSQNVDTRSQAGQIEYIKKALSSEPEELYLENGTSHESIISIKNQTSKTNNGNVLVDLTTEVDADDTYR